MSAIGTTTDTGSPADRPRARRPSAGRRASMVLPLTQAERAARGKAARAAAPLASHEFWEATAGRTSPIDLLEAQAATRVPELVPIRHGRMLVSPFTYYRGAALPMASDLSTTPVSGLRVQLCGDAHLSNFGIFGSPERHLFFDVNDFDETAIGPWEWDVKRLAASLEVAARENGYRRKERQRIVADAIRSYRQAIRRIRPSSRCSRSGTPTWTWTGCTPSSSRSSTRRPRRPSGGPWPRLGPTTTCRPTTSCARWSGTSPGS